MGSRLILVSSTYHAAGHCDHRSLSFSQAGILTLMCNLDMPMPLLPLLSLRYFFLSIFRTGQLVVSTSTSTSWIIKERILISQISPPSPDTSTSTAPSPPS